MKPMSIISAVIFFFFALSLSSMAQSRPPYPHASTDRIIRPKTAMLPLPVNVPFLDPDFGSRMVRATDETTNFILPGTYLINESSGQLNEWSVNSNKFYVLGEGGQTLAFGFDPVTMTESSLPYAEPGQAFAATDRITYFQFD
jgi:hypothetical protein